MDIRWGASQTSTSPDRLWATLSGATGITNEKLEQNAYSLAGATMPHGQKYEDWPKSRGEGDSGS